MVSSVDGFTAETSQLRGQNWRGHTWHGAFSAGRWGRSSGNVRLGGGTLPDQPCWTLRRLRRSSVKNYRSSGGIQARRNGAKVKSPFKITKITFSKIKHKTVSMSCSSFRLKTYLDILSFQDAKPNDPEIFCFKTNIIWPSVWGGHSWTILEQVKSSELPTRNLEWHQHRFKHSC